MFASDYNRYTQIIVWLLLGFMIIIAGFCCYIFGAFAGELVILFGILYFVIFVFYKLVSCQGMIREQLEIDLGFTFATWVTKVNTFSLEKVLMIKSVTPGGLFDKAGFEAEDIILDNLAIFDFFPLLYKQRGRGPITFTVGTLDPDKKTVSSKTRLVTVQIPAKKN